MKGVQHLTCVIRKEGDGYSSLCPELDVASQGETVEEARANLIEALELFFESADPSEVAQRLGDSLYVSPIEVKVG
jgi:predicted RNase H-like HicB family nuclease